ncbi:hypothetical protein ACWDWO_21595 [Actinopolymorpha singaporensis]
MPKFFPAVATFDVEQADGLVWEAFRKRGYTQVSSRHGEQICTDKVGARLAEIFKSSHVIRDRKQLKADPDRAAWREDIAEELFGDEPLLHSAATPEEEAARDRLVTLAWEYSGTSLTSPLNTALSEIDGYVLLQTRVAKKRPRPGMRGVAIPAEAKFLTQNLDLILDLGVSRGVVGWRRATERFEALLKEIGDRQPELRLAIAKAVARELPSVTGVLVHADVKAISASRGQERAQPNELD